MRTKVMRNNGRRRAISGAVTSLILIIAGVLIALVVVSFGFGFFGFNRPNIQLVGPAYITAGGNGALPQLRAQISTNQVVQIDSISIDGKIETFNPGEDYTFNTELGPGAIGCQNYPLPNVTLAPGETVDVIMGFSNGQSVSFLAEVVPVGNPVFACN